MNTQNLSFDDYSEMYHDLQCRQSPAELHGWLCGQLAVGERLLPHIWLTAVNELLDREDELSSEQQQPFLQLLRDSEREMNDKSLGFQLLLPGDDDDLSYRAECLGKWCDGFLSGFGSALSRPDESELTEDVTDTLRDLVAIAQISQDEEESEDNETSYMQLVEYVRLAVLTIHDDCVPTPSSEPSKPASDSELTFNPFASAKKLH